MASVNITSHSYLCQNSSAEVIDPNRRVGCSLTSLKISLVWPQTLNTILAQHDCSKYQYLDIFHFLNVIFFFSLFISLLVCLYLKFSNLNFPAWKLPRRLLGSRRRRPHTAPAPSSLLLAPSVQIESNSKQQTTKCNHKLKQKNSI